MDNFSHFQHVDTKREDFCLVPGLHRIKVGKDHRCNMFAFNSSSVLTIPSELLLLLLFLPFFFSFFFFLAGGR